MLISPSILFAHGWGRHGNDLCFAMFGYSQKTYQPNNGNVDEMYELLGMDDTYCQAFEIIKNAVAVAIDYSNAGKNDTAYNYLLNIKGNFKHGLPGKYELAVSTRSVGNGNHRNMCHQGFDFNYEEYYLSHYHTKDAKEFEVQLKRRKELDKRWSLGRQLLIDSASYAFKLNSNNDSIATLIAMNAYYIHLLGDLETNEYKALHPIDSYHALLSEYISKIQFYGMQLPRQSSSLVNSMVDRMNIYLKTLKTGIIEGKDLVSFKYTKGILNILHEYLPEIINRVTYISNYSKVS